MKKHLKRLIKEEDGNALSEYILMLLLVVAVVIIVNPDAREIIQDLIHDLQQRVSQAIDF